MLFGFLPLLLTALGLSLLLGSDDDQPDASDELTLTDGDDLLRLEDTGATTINALGGDDVILSSEPRDIVLRLGEGNDRAELLGGGNATIHGYDGNDTVSMVGAGSLLAYLGMGDDVVSAFEATVEAYGGGGNDTMNGGAGDDMLVGGTGNDAISGEFGADSLNGGFGNDTLVGDAGDDLLIDFNGNDLLMGGEGNDTIETDGRGDTIFGDAGDDLIVAVTAFPAGTLGSLIDGGDGDDTIIGDMNATITGGDGADDITVLTTFGSTANPAVITDFDPAMDRLTLDTQTGGTSPAAPVLDLRAAANGTDVEVLLDGKVYVLLRDVALTDALAAQIGMIAESGPGNEIVTGTDGNDTLTGLGADTLSGGAGDDLLVGQTTGDTSALSVTAPGILQGGEGDDTLIGGPGDILTGGEGADRFEVHSAFPASGPTVITDFDNATDQLQVTYYIGEGEDAGLYEGSLRQNGDTLEVLVNNRVLVQLPGITAPIGWALSVAPDNA